MDQNPHGITTVKRIVKAKSIAMTDSNSPNGQGFKSLVAKGVIGAVTLAGTTAIPLLVQQRLTPPAPTASPSPSIMPAQVVPSPTVSVTPTQVTPSPTPVQLQPDATTPVLVPVQEDDDSSRKGRKKKDKGDD